MSFRCEKCKTSKPAHSKPTVLVTEWYEEQGRRDIKKEIRVCRECAEKIQPPAPAVPPEVSFPVLTPEDVKAALVNRDQRDLDQKLSETFTRP